MRIIFVTGNRAEYGLLKRLIKLSVNSDKFKAKLVVTGDHLSNKIGTISEINKDGIEISGKISCEPKIDSPLGILDAMGSALSDYAQFFCKNKPDVIVILGDRYEMLVVAIACHIYKIPLIHISGGEVTLGSLDDTIRHAITKFADYHFVAIEEFKKRIIQMGESSSRIHVVGGMGVDAIHNLRLFNFDQTLEKLHIKNKCVPIVLCTYHSVTAEDQTLDECIEMIKALKRIDNVNIIITYPNPDHERDKILDCINQLIISKENVYLYESLGQLLYLSVLKYSKCVIGNSSSGISEAPYFGVTTINIGSRQTGRPRCPSIVDVPGDAKKIYNEINNTLKLDNKSTKYETYGSPGASEKILHFIENNIGTFSKKQGFLDIDF